MRIAAQRALIVRSRPDALKSLTSMPEVKVKMSIVSAIAAAFSQIHVLVARNEFFSGKTRLFKMVDLTVSKRSFPFGNQLLEQRISSNNFRNRPRRESLQTR